MYLHPFLSKKGKERSNGGHWAELNFVVPWNDYQVPCTWESRQPHYEHMETHVVAFIGFWNAHQALQNEAVKISPVRGLQNQFQNCFLVLYKTKLAELPALLYEPCLGHCNLPNLLKWTPVWLKNQPDCEAGFHFSDSHVLTLKPDRWTQIREFEDKHLNKIVEDLHNLLHLPISPLQIWLTHSFHTSWIW